MKKKENIKKLMCIGATVVLVVSFLAMFTAGASAEGGYTFVTEWGINKPFGIAVDSSGYVFVSELMNHRIQKFDSDGSFITKWGSQGTGNGQFFHPHDIAVDSSGSVYVVDHWNHRIQKFDSDGSFITKWGSQGTGNGQFSYPTGIAVDSSGYVFVTDICNVRIQKFDSDGNFITKWGSPGTGDGEFDVLRGIAVDSSGYVFVSDGYNYRIQKFDSDGNFITKWGSKGSGEGEFLGPGDITVDCSGNVYVTDGSNDRIQKFAPGTPELPDLTLSSSDISFSNPNPGVGETVTITATIHNIGDADAAEVIVQFFNGDPDDGGTKIEDDQTIASISAGGTGTAHVDWTVLSENEIHVVIDPEDTIQETNEDNNKGYIVLISSGFLPSDDGFAFGNLYMISELHWGGWCLGMSLTSGDYYLDIWSVLGQGLPSPSSSCNPQANIPPSGCANGPSPALDCFSSWAIMTNSIVVDGLFYGEITSPLFNVQYIDISQVNCQIMNTEYQHLKNYLSMGGATVIAFEGHAVVAYRILELQSEKRIYIYDPNRPGDDNVFLTLHQLTPDCLTMDPYTKCGLNYDRFVCLVPGRITENWVTLGNYIIDTMSIRVFSPVNLVVSDPDGKIISQELNNVPNTMYKKVDINGDGDPDDVIVIPDRKIGDYRIEVIPEPDAEPTDTYTLEVSTEGTTTVLAENVPISEIPEEPYIFESTNRTCGDVNGDGKVTMSDVRKVFNRYLDPDYPLDLSWAADVNCDGKVSMSDVRKVFNRYLDPGYELNCCCGGVE